MLTFLRQLTHVSPSTKPSTCVGKTCSTIATFATYGSSDIASKIGASVGVLILSLIAASLPTVSRRVPALNINRNVFLVLKHFGTGVILSTAFVHLLQDAFQTLLSLEGPIREWVGLLVLCSVLGIFMIEYLSMTYVERLESGDTDEDGGQGHHHHWPPLSSSATIKSPHHSHAPSHIHSYIHSQMSSQAPQQAMANPYGSIQRSITSLPPLQETEETTSPSLTNRAVNVLDGNNSDTTSETTALLNVNRAGARPIPHTRRPKIANRPGSMGARSFGYGARPEFSESGTYARSEVGSQESTDAESASFFSGHHRYESSSVHSHHTVRARRMPSVADLTHALPNASTEEQEQIFVHDYHERGQPVSTISAPASLHDGTDEYDDIEIEHEAHVDEKRQIVTTIVLQIGIMFHSLVIGLTLSMKSNSDFTSLLTAIAFHQLFEGLSLGVRISVLPNSSDKVPLLALLKPILCLLFSLTVPFGIFVGMATLSSTKVGDSTKLVQGIMSAVSAGMLIYASCIEMLAADFVMDPQLKKGPIIVQFVSIASMLMGVCSMAILG